MILLIKKSHKKDKMFSIIIPTYNQDYLLYKAIQSVIKQTFQDWEAIIVNNYSDDKTIKIIKSFDDTEITFNSITS